MIPSQLRDFFVGVGVKRLSAVDAEPRKSNQHEVGTTRQMRDRFLGQRHRERLRVVYVWLGQDDDGIRAEGYATHYDARIFQSHRTAEWRLYYPSNAVTEAMRAGDTLFLAMDSDRLLYFIVTPAGSTSERQLSWLFGIAPTGRSFVSKDFSERGPELGFAARFVLDEIGIEYEERDADNLDGYIEQYKSFPTTAVFSDLARRSLPEVEADGDPDAALVAWLDREEALFRRLERRVVAARLERGFMVEEGTDVDGFIHFSLSVQNRRKARMGLSLENHLEAVFQARSIAYERGAVTELNHRPDFLFPSAEAYHAAPAEGSSRLTMLGAKSTCKDRWRQVLAEAAKIRRKHLLTLEPGISESQTLQMEGADLQLVVPDSIQDTYSEGQQAWLWTLREFIREVQTRSWMS